MKTEYRGFEIVDDGTYGLKRIKMVGRGALPKALKGRYTHQRSAEQAIDAYEATKPKGKKKDDEADNISTD